VILSFVIFSVYLFAKILPVSFLLSSHLFFFCVTDKTRGAKHTKKEKVTISKFKVPEREHKTSFIMRNQNFGC